MKEENKIFDSLLADYFSGEISEEKREALFDMIMENGGYRKQYEEEARLYSLLQIPRIESKQDQYYVQLKEKLKIGTTKRINTWQKSLMAVAASLLLIVFSSILSILIYEDTAGSKNIQYVEMSTPFGGQTRVVLPDGSIAWLNSKSGLKYKSDFGRANRDLELSGEAYFEVTKNKELAFTVKANNIEIVAIGTSFNVRSYPDDNFCRVQLLHGCVDVFTSNDEFRLKPNEELDFDVQSGKSYVKSFNVDRAVQWTKGRLSFDNTSLSEIVKDLERNYNTEIRVESEKLSEEFFVGNINLNMNLFDVLEYIDVDNKFRIVQLEDYIIIKDKK